MASDFSLIYWDYYKREADEYTGMMRVHEKIKPGYWYAGGVWTWDGWSTQNRYSIEALKNNLESCRECGVENIIVTCWGDGGGVFAGAILFLLLLRVVFSLPVKRRAILPLTDALFGEAVGLRVLAAALAGAALACYELAVSGTRDYALYFSAAAILSPTLLSLLYIWALDRDGVLLALLGEMPSSTPRARALSELSLLALSTTVAYCLLPLSLFGLSMATLFTAAVTLFTSRRFGAARGGAVGLITGLLSGPARAASFSLLGLVSGLFFPLGTLFGLTLGMAGAVGFAVYTEGLSGFLGTAPEIAVAVLLFLPVLRGASEGDTATYERERVRLLEATRSAAAEAGGEGGRLSRLGGALSELSALFHRLSSEERRPSVSEYFGECQRVCARYCATCSSRIRCWEQGDRVAESAIFSLATRLRDVGRIARTDLPPALGDGCPRIESILDEIRDGCAEMALARHKGDRNEFLSLDYAMLSKLLSDAATADREEAAENTEGVRRLTQALGGRRGLSVSVFGTRERRVAIGARGEGELYEERDALHAAAEEALSARLSVPKTEVLDGGAVLLMKSVHRYRAEAASSSLPLVGSGDRLRHFESPDGYFYAVLSDGMGKGEEAAAVAGVSVDFLEAMLKGGCSRRASLRMLNSLVRGRQSECSATVDMLIFDLYEGHAAFLKSGAAPSYIKRGSEVLRVKSRTMPLGMMKMPDAELLHVEVALGDIVVLLSDGLFSDDEDPAWLFRMLVSEDTEDLGALANRIVAEATARIPEPRDDITVGLFRIEEAASEDIEEA